MQMGLMLIYVAGKLLRMESKWLFLEVMVLSSWMNSNPLHLLLDWIQVYCCFLVIFSKLELCNG